MPADIMICKIQRLLLFVFLMQAILHSLRGGDGLNYFADILQEPPCKHPLLLSIA